MAVTQQFSAGENLTAAKLNTSSIPVVSATSDITTPFTGQIVYNTTSGSLHRYTGSTWVLFDSNTQWIYKTATESVTSSTTLQNDNDFAFSVPTTGTYALEGYLIYDGSTSADLKVAITVPASATLNWSPYAPTSGVGTTDYNVQVITTSGGTRGVACNGATVMSCQPKGTILLGGSAGTVQLQWAQVASNATATRIFINSWMKLTRIA